MTPKKLDELAVGETYLFVPREGLVVRKAPRVALATEGEVLALSTDLMRLAIHGDVVVFDVPAPAEEPAPEAPVDAPEPTPELEQSPESSPTRNTRRGARGDS